MFLVPNAPFRYVGRVRQGPELAIKIADKRDVTDGIGKLRKSYN